MTNSTLLLILALCGAALPAQAAALPCSTYLAGFAAGDEIVLGEAARLADRLIASAWSSPAMTSEEGSGTAARGRRDLVLRQLRRNCQALPRANVQDIVGILNRAAGLPPLLSTGRAP